MANYERENLPNQDMKRVFLAGFSQGGMLALAAYLKYKGTTPFAGIICLSSNQAL